MKQQMEVVTLVIVLVLVMFLSSGCGKGLYSEVRSESGSSEVGSWSSISIPSGFTARAAALTQYVGDRVMMWGGEDSLGSVGDGAIYDPSSDSWTLMSSAAAPSHRTDLFNVRGAYTGSSENKIVVWGGRNSNGAYYSMSSTHISQYDGAIYDADTDAWTAMAPIPAGQDYAGRAYLHSFWTGSEMIFWGGSESSFDGSTNFAASSTDPAYGSIFDPGDWNTSGDDTWSAMSLVNAPSNRKHAVAVWTGSEMLVWGGMYDNGSTVNYYNDGASYNPSTNTWTSISNANAPSGRRFAFYAWTGSELIIWGGLGLGEVPLNDGAIYTPATDTWVAISSTDAPTARASTATAIWTGSHFVVLGGMSVDASFNFTYYSDGAIYDPNTDSWEELPDASDYLDDAGKRQLVYMGNGKIFTWGGWTGNDTYSDKGAILTLGSGYYQ